MTIFRIIKYASTNQSIDMLEFTVISEPSNLMTREIHCLFLNKQAPALERKPWPGELGQRIFDTISLEAWKKWQEHQIILINEYQLNTMDEKAIKLLEDHMIGFLFGEGEYNGVLPDGFTPKQ